MDKVYLSQNYRVTARISGAPSITIVNIIVFVIIIIIIIIIIYLFDADLKINFNNYVKKLIHIWIYKMRLNKIYLVNSLSSTDDPSSSTPISHLLVA